VLTIMSDIKPRQDQSPNEATISIDWRLPDDFPSVYANNVYTQSGEYEIILSFFQTKLPLLTGTPEENKAKLQQLGKIPAECVSRVIVHPDLIPKMIQALQITWDGYRATKELIERSKSE